MIGPLGHTFHRIRIAVVLLLAVALAGCFGVAQVTSPLASHGPASDTTSTAVPIDSIAPAAVTPTPVVAPVMLDIHAIAVAIDADSTMIDGATGGSISNGVVRVDVPAGAFNGVARIGFAMTDPATMQADIRISPDSLNHFVKPVTLTFLCQGKSVGAATGMLWYEPSKAQWYGLTSSVYDSTSDAVSVGVRHFSRYGAGGRAGW